jgi:hypothetical protein
MSHPASPVVHGSLSLFEKDFGAACLDEGVFPWNYNYDPGWMKVYPWLQFDLKK